MMSVTTYNMYMYKVQTLQVDHLGDPVLRPLRPRADRQHHQPHHPLQQVGG